MKNGYPNLFNIIRCIGIIIILFIPIAALSNSGRVFITGNDLKEYCEQSSNFCFGYVTAVVDDVTISSNQNQYCLPNDMNVESLQQVVMQFMDANPDLLVITGAGVVKHALSSSFPCES